MSRLGFSIGLVAAIVANILYAGGLSAADVIRWAPDLEVGRKAASQFNVPLLIHFYGDNCLPCQTLNERVYSRPELIETLNKYFICVRINATSDRKTAAEFQVHSWPTDVFVSPDGTVLYQGACKQDVNGYLATLQHVAISNRDRSLMLTADQARQPAAQAPGASPPYSQQVNLQQSSMYADARNLAAPSATSPSPAAAAAGIPVQNRFTQNQYAQNQYAQNQYAQNQYAQNQYAQNSAAFGQPAVSPSVATPPAGQPAWVAQPTAATQNSAQPVGLLAQHSHPPQTQSPYAHSAGATAAASLLPTPSDVARGPVPPQNQPQSLAFAVQGAQQQVAGPAAPVSNNANGAAAGQLPDYSRAAQVAMPSTEDLGRGPNLGATQGMPRMTSQNQFANPEFAAANGQNVFSNSTPKPTEVGSQTLLNPYFHAPEEQPAAAAQLNANTPAGLSLNEGSASPVNRQPANAATNQRPVSTVSHQANFDPKTALMVNEPVSQPAAHPSQSARATQATASNPAVASASDHKTLETDAMQPALEGYCPVALKASGEWVAGDAKYSVRHRGRVYWLSSQDAVREFMAAPDTCSPVLSGYDPLILLEEGRLVEGSVQFGLHEQVSGAYLLFSSEDAKQKYWDDFDVYSKALRVLLEKANAR